MNNDTFYIKVKFEAWAGIEPAHGGFAVPSVTTSPPRLLCAHYTRKALLFLGPKRRMAATCVTAIGHSIMLLLNGDWYLTDGSLCPERPDSMPPKLF